MEDLEHYEAYIANELIKVDKDLDDNLTELTKLLGEDTVDQLQALKRAHCRIKLIKDHQMNYLLSQHAENQNKV